MSGGVICEQEPRCVAAVGNAIEVAKTNKKEALRLMLWIYAEFPDPRLAYNIGRLCQQTDEPHAAVIHFRQFLDSGAEQNPERLAKARTFLEQAEKDSRLLSLPAPAPPLPLPKASPVVPLAIGLKSPAKQVIETRQAYRQPWRIAVGLSAIVGGGVTVAFGAAALEQNGQCVLFSSAIVTPRPCLQSLDTTAVGAGLLTGGILLTVTGALLGTIPSHRRTFRIASRLAATGLAVAGYSGY